MADLVVNVRVREKLSRDLKDWPKKRIAIEGNICYAFLCLYNGINVEWESISYKKQYRVRY